MNKSRRSKLRNAIRFLDSASVIIDSVCEGEQDCVNNTPENLQGTERFECMEDAVDHLNDALDQLYEVKDHIQVAIGR